MNKTYMRKFREKNNKQVLHIQTWCLIKGLCSVKLLNKQHKQRLFYGYPQNSPLVTITTKFI